MEAFEAVRTVLAVRRYRAEPLQEATVRRIVEAGRLTASSMNLQPWHFVVVQDRRTLARLGGIARTGRYVAEAPLAIAVAVERTRFAVSDASRAIQSMMLTAWAEGVGSNWIGFVMPAVNDVLGIPAELDVLALVSFGYPGARLGRGKKQRKPLGDVASRERYGTPVE